MGRPPLPFEDKQRTARYLEAVPLTNESPAALLTAARMVSRKSGDGDATFVLNKLAQDLPGEAAKIRKSLETTGKH